MTKKHSTKRSLIASILILCLCITSLVGTTFAWFTDEVTSANNIIQTGKLDIEMEYATVANGQLTDWAKVQGADNIFDPNALWEPGRVEVAYLKVSNLGSLALKYQLAVNVVEEIPGVNVAGEEFKLSDYLVFKVVDMPDSLTPYSDREAVTTAAGTEKGLKDYNSAATPLEVGGVDYVALIIYMPESVGNEANYRGDAIPTIKLGVNIYATQQVSESDSFGNDYDADAWHEFFTATSVEELETAIASANDGDVIKLGADIESTDGVIVTDKDVTIDLNGKTFTVSEGATTNNRVFKINGDSNVTIKNGTLIAEGDITSGAYGTVRTEGTANVTLENVKMYSYRGYGLNVKARPGTTVILNGCEVYSQYGGGVEAEGGTIILNDSTIKQEGVYSGAAWCSVAIGVNGNGKVVVNSGDYSAKTIATDSNAAQGTWVAYVMSSGGTLEINGGNFNGVVAETANAANACGIICADRAAIVNIKGGNFNSNGAILDMRNNDGIQPNPQAVISGGVFTADPTVSGLYSSNLISIADGYQLLSDGAGTWGVYPELENGLTLTTVPGYNGLYTDGSDYYVYTAEGLISMNKFWLANPYTNSMWGRTYNIMADIDATGYTWNQAYVIVGDNNNAGFVFDGNGHTITGLTINNGLFSGTPNGGNVPSKPGYMQNITFDGVTVTGDHWAGVLWSNICNELVIKNVSVINSTITGKCNVAALVGGTVIDGAPDASVTFINCVVKNNVITATGTHSGVEGDWYADPTGANVYLARAFDNTYVTFENCVSENNTVINGEGLVGGGIYGYTTISNGWWAGTGACDSFTNWNGLTVSNNAADLSNTLNNGGTAILNGNLTVNGQVNMNGGELNGNGATITVQKDGSYSTSDCAINTTGGTISNVTINGNPDNTRAIGSGSTGDNTLESDLIINNVFIDKVQYAINGSGETGTEKVIVTNSTIYGWSSYSNIELFSFENCTLGMGNSYDGYITVYGNTSFTNCNFEGVFDLGARADNGVIHAEGCTVTFTNCYYDGVKVTAENFIEYFYYGPGDARDFGYLMSACTIVVDGVTVDNSAYING